MLLKNIFLMVKYLWVTGLVDLSQFIKTFFNYMEVLKMAKKKAAKKKKKVAKKKKAKKKKKK